MGWFWPASYFCPGEQQWTPVEQGVALGTMSLKDSCQSAADGSTRAVSLSLEVLPVFLSKRGK